MQIQDDKLSELAVKFADYLLKLLNKKVSPGQMTYGFEYEFIATKPLDLGDMERLYDFLPKCGFKPEGKMFLHPSGTYITFEPGGQIEYHSIPLYAGDGQMVHGIIELINEINSKIANELGIKYVATGYIPGRANAPLCLMESRYQNLHSRMPMSGTRGLEMMMGTASIHLHARICNIKELAPLFYRMCQMTTMVEFRMQSDRRDIWNNTDQSRCGLPYSIPENSDAHRVIDEIVMFTLKADDIAQNIPFYETEDLSLDAFMYHMTTIFTDVRFNLKGPSIELRTLDSMPFPQFIERWDKFVNEMEAIAMACE